MWYQIQPDNIAASFPSKIKGERVKLIAWQAEKWQIEESSH